MKLSLLDMTQNILSAMDSDTVNNIGDTTESLQVAEAIKETYFDLISGRDWPFLKTNGTLTGLGDTNNPTKMRFPETINKVYWIKYNKKDVCYMEAKEFQDMLDLRQEQTDVVDSNGFIINRDPQYWTSFDDDYVVFDSINYADDSTLQESKSNALMLRVPEWRLENDFIPDLPDKMFPLLLADAKSTCFINLKQTQNSKEDRKAQRLRVRMQNESYRNDKAEPKSNTAVNYGRK